jgi:transcriptional regulator with XRE-family HTH domain
MNGFRKHLWQNLKNRVFRREYVAENVKMGVAMQIKAMRESRRWSQADLAQRADKAQSAIARLEDPDYGKFSIQTLLEMADAFDVWLSVEFIAFSKGVAKTEDRSASALNAVSFGDDWEGRGISSPTSTSSSKFILNWLEPSMPPPFLGYSRSWGRSSPSNTPTTPGASADVQFVTMSRPSELHSQSPRIEPSFSRERATFHQNAGTN